VIILHSNGSNYCISIDELKVRSLLILGFDVFPEWILTSVAAEIEHEEASLIVDTSNLVSV
jgi:hypothetical protein